MGGVSLDWSSAEVRKGKLEVRLSGRPPRGWKGKFERTVALLPGGEWGKVAARKDRVVVEQVSEGAEERLHHFLESVVLQANSSFERKDAEEQREQDEAGDEPKGPDAEMTERFRSFSSEAEEAQHKEE